ncbi:MAG: NADH-quinone oxidoreductase subunit L, partial [Gammaproteobacteria bacterium]
GAPRSEVGKRPGWRTVVPVVVLAVLSVVGGWVELPPALGDLPVFTNFLQQALPPPRIGGGSAIGETGLEVLAGVASVGGILIAYLLFLRYPGALARLASSAPAKGLRAFWHIGWGFDWLYDHLFVAPYVWFARIDKHDFVDAIYTGVARFCELCYRGFSASQTGQLRWYAAGIAAGAIVVTFVAVFA